MELKGVFVIAATCLLASMEVVSSLHSLSSSRKRHQGCGGGNLVKITDNCGTAAGSKQCEVKLAGETTRDNRTRFKIEEPDKKNKPGLYCIQFTDIHDSNRKYALRAINGSSLAFEEGGCQGNIGSDFLFEEQATADYMTYTYRPSSYTGKCITGGCDRRLSVINVNNTKDRKCYFRKLA